MNCDGGNEKGCVPCDAGKRGIWFAKTTIVRSARVSPLPRSLLAEGEVAVVERDVQGAAKPVPSSAARQRVPCAASVDRSPCQRNEPERTHDPQRGVGARRA